MTWVDDDASDHEGYVLGVIENPTRRTQWIELGSGDVLKSVSQMVAACECGWRSERISFQPAAEWDGYLYATEPQRDRAARLWREHIALVLYRRRTGLSDDRAYIGQLLLQDLEALDRCLCGHERRAHPRGPCTFGHGACACPRFRFMPTPP